MVAANTHVAALSTVALARLATVPPCLADKRSQWVTSVFLRTDARRAGRVRWADARWRARERIGGQVAGAARAVSDSGAFALCRRVFARAAVRASRGGDHPLHGLLAGRGQPLGGRVDADGSSSGRQIRTAG